MSCVSAKLEALVVVEMVSVGLGTAVGGVFGRTGDLSGAIIGLDVCCA